MTFSLKETKWLAPCPTVAGSRLVDFCQVYLEISPPTLCPPLGIIVPEVISLVLTNNQNLFNRKTRCRLERMQIEKTKVYLSSNTTYLSNLSIHCPSIHSSIIYLSIYSSFNILIYPYIHLYVYHLSIYHSTIHPSVHPPSIYSSVHHLSINL